MAEVLIQRSFRMVVVLVSVMAAMSVCIAQPRIRVSPGLNINFGDVYTDNAYARILTIVNAGTDTLRLGDINADCSCAVGDLKSKVIAPSDSESMRVMFNSHAHEGTVKQNLVMSTNDPKERLVRISIYATVNRLYTVIPDELKFGQIPAGTPRRESVRIVSASSDTLRIVSIQTKSDAISVQAKSTVIPPNGQTELTVVARSKVPGPHFGGVVVTFDDPRQRLGGFRWYYSVGGTKNGKGKKSVGLKQ